MVTNQIMETTDRELMGHIIKQRTKDSYFHLDSIIACCKRFRIDNNLKEFNLNNFLSNTNTQEFIQALRDEIKAEPYIKGTKNRSGWVHPYLALKILLYTNPKFEVKVYKWLWDLLIEKRIDSGDSYMEMCGRLYTYSHNKAQFPRNIKGVANKIKEIIGCDDWNQATKEQLKERDLIQTYIADMATTFKDSKLGLKYGVVLFLEKHRGVE